MIAFGLVFAALAFISSSLVQGYKGTDNRAVDTVADLTGGSYKPWISPIWQPERDMERLLFSLQASIGGILFGYFIASVNKHELKLYRK